MKTTILDIITLALEGKSISFYQPGYDKSYEVKGIVKKVISVCGWSCEEFYDQGVIIEFSLEDGEIYEIGLEDTLKVE
jgi:hypothetical protein